MEIAIPTALKSLASAGSAIRELTAWRKRARGDARAIVGELKENLGYLDMVAEDGVPLGDVIRKISNQEYKRLAKAGYDFDGLKKGRIRSYSSLKGTELDSWSGKSTEDLVESIYDKIGQLIICGVIGNSVWCPTCTVHCKYIIVSISITLKSDGFSVSTP